MNLNLFPCDLLSRFYDAAAEPFLQRSAVELYHHYQTIRNTFTTNAMPGWAAWAMGGTLVVLFFLLAVLSPRTHREVSVPSLIVHPNKLFEELLQKLDLTSEEKYLLREMAEGARLQHPAMSLLSPRLLDSARAVWRKEKGDAVISPLKLQQIDAICCKLYDHLPPSSIAEQRRADETIPV